MSGFKANTVFHPPLFRGVQRRKNRATTQNRGEGGFRKKTEFAVFFHWRGLQVDNKQKLTGRGQGLCAKFSRGPCAGFSWGQKSKGETGREIRLRRNEGKTPVTFSFPKIGCGGLGGHWQNLFAGAGCARKGNGGPITGGAHTNKLEGVSRQVGDGAAGFF